MGPSPYMTYCAQCGSWVESNMFYNNPYNNPYNNWQLRNYSYYNYPGVWNQWGLHNSYYPGPGNFVAGKPNIYIDTKSKKEIRVELKFSEGSNLLAASPKYSIEKNSNKNLSDLESTAGWSIVAVEKGKLQNADSDAVYDYLYYDYKFHQESLQNKEGFCVKHSELVPRMEAILYALEFNQNEVDNFFNYWTNKFSPDIASEFCVYPQSNLELDKIVKLNIAPTPKKILRVDFVVIPMPTESSKFINRPVTDWDPKQYAINESYKDEDIVVREWGIILPVQVL